MCVSLGGAGDLGGFFRCRDRRCGHKSGGFRDFSEYGRYVDMRRMHWMQAASGVGGEERPMRRKKQNFNYSHGMCKYLLINGLRISWVEIFSGWAGKDVDSVRGFGYRL